MKKAIPDEYTGEYCLVLSTAADLAEARRLARVLVEERWAACANLIPISASVYRWQGKMEESSEVLLLFKTRRERAEGLLGRLKEIHAYECPEGLILPVLGGLEGYLEWIQESTPL